MAKRAAEWLQGVQNRDGGWGGDRGIASSIEETSVAVAALGDSAAWVVEATRNGEDTPPAPIGFYFARLWYYERLYPLIFAADALARASGYHSG